MFTRRVRLLLTGAVMVVLLSATLLLEAPEPTMAVDDLMDNPSAKSGDTISIRGQVVNGTIDNQTQMMTIKGEIHELVIDFSIASVSNGLDDGRMVYAEGTLVEEGDNWVFHADVIKTSCPSKYEPE